MLINSEKTVSKLVYFESIDSTNLALARLAAELPDFSAVVSAEQTQGQGRMGRSWVSEPGTSLSLSVLIKAQASPEQLGLITFMAAAAVSAALASYGLKASIKWPNDVLVDGKKICGILAQLTQSGLILGIGVNLKQQSGAPDTATSLAQLGLELELDDFLPALLIQLRARYVKFLADPQWACQTYLEEFRQHSSTLGSQVRAIFPDQSELVGTAMDVDSEGRLLISSGGQVRAVSAADIVHLRN